MSVELVAPSAFEGLSRYRLFLLSIAIFLAAQIVFLIGISAPDQLYFDEVHYVGAARQMLGQGETLNREHPPFAKELMAASIAVLGDRPRGWRYPSVVFGALSLVGIFLLARRLFAREEAALWTVATTLVNQMLYVQSRIAMLDIFMVAFTIWALVFLAIAWDAPQPRRWFAACGACLGLAAASKWSGLFPWAMVLGIVLLVGLLRGWRVSFAEARPSDWYRPGLWQEMRLRDWIVTLVVVPGLLYFATFVPSEGLDPGALLRRQAEMAQAMSNVPAVHPYLSRWTDWPIIRRPIWYLFDQTARPDHIGAVMLLGNPLILWAGIPALLVCLRDWVTARRRAAFLIAMSGLSLYLAWAVVPKQGGFFYYYFPTAMMLGPALGYVFFETPLVRRAWLRSLFLIAAATMFFYLLPVSSAATGVTLTGYAERMWFDGWR